LGPRPRRYKSLAERVAAALAGEPGASAERARELRNAAAVGGRKAVAYYDLTFSPVKSVSVFYAALLHAERHREAGELVAAHRAAIARAMGWASAQAAYCRTGYHGKACDGRSVGVYETASGLVWTRWDHGTNRAGEPQLHSHVAVLNRVISGVDGRIRALHGRGSPRSNTASTRSIGGRWNANSVSGWGWCSRSGRTARPAKSGG
jgi:conjugative relaxase-like TrwC/TraI family protein